MWKKFNSFIHLFPHLPFAVAMFWGPLLRVCLGLLNSNIHPWSQIQKNWKFFLFLVKLLARWSDCISALALSHLGVGPADLPAIVVDREIFRVLQGLLPLRPSPKEKRRHENKAMQVLDFSIFCNFEGFVLIYIIYPFSPIYLVCAALCCLLAEEQFEQRTVISTLKIRKRFSMPKQA